MTNAVKLNSSNGNLELIKETIARQNEQGAGLVNLIDTFQRNEKKTLAKMQKIEHNVQLISDKIESRITLSESEAYVLQSLVYKRSNILAHYAINILHGSSDWGGNEYYLKKVGQIRMILYKHLKHYFNVRKYPLILEKDYRKALGYLESQNIEDFNTNEFRDTPTQLKLLEAM